VRLFGDKCACHTLGPKFRFVEYIPVGIRTQGSYKGGSIHPDTGPKGGSLDQPGEDVACTRMADGEKALLQPIRSTQDKGFARFSLMRVAAGRTCHQV
jgi:hypothetical protein